MKQADFVVVVVVVVVVFVVVVVCLFVSWFLNAPATLIVYFTFSGTCLVNFTCCRFRAEVADQS